MNTDRLYQIIRGPHVSKRARARPTSFGRWF